MRLHAARRAGPFRITHKSYAAAFTQPWHEHDTANIDFVLAGGGVGVYGKAEIASGPAAVEYFAAGLRHRFASGAAGIRTLHLVMPAELPRAAGIDAESMARRLDASAALGPASALLAEISRAEPDGLVLESLAYALLDAVGACDRHRDEGPWLARVRELLLDAPELAGSLASIASRVGRHPSHVAREFRRAHGLTVGEFGRRVRLSRAARALAADRHHPLAGIACEQGFSDQAHFTRAFRAVAGRSPGRFRAELAAGPGSAVSDGDAAAQRC